MVASNWLMMLERNNSRYNNCVQLTFLNLNVSVDGDALINKDFETAASWFDTFGYLKCTFLNFLAIVSCFGTVVNIIVLHSSQMASDGSSILLVSLSISELFFSLTIPVSLFRCFVAGSVDIVTIMTIDVYYNEYVAAFSRGCYCTSITLVGVIAIERFILVYFPLKAAVILTPVVIRTISVCVYLGNFALISPMFFCFSHMWVFDQTLNTTVPVFVATELYLNNIEAINFSLAFAYNVVVLGSSLLVTLVLTPAIAFRLWQVAKTRTMLTGKQFSFNPQTAKVLLTICSLCTLIYTPYVLMDTVMYFLPSSMDVTYLFNYYTIITDLSGTISGCVNFCVYAALSSKFRKQCKKLFSRRNPFF